MVTARTFSGPKARAARNVTTLESIPPESPTTARSNPARRISLRMKRQRIAVTSSGLMRSPSSAGFRFHSGRRLMRWSSSMVNSSRSSRASGVMSRWRRSSAGVERGRRSGFVEHGGLGQRAAVGPDDRLPPQKHSPSSKPTRLTRITTAPSNWAKAAARCS